MLAGLCYNSTMSAKYYKKILIAVIVVVIITIPLVWFFYSSNNNLKINYLDVGQGDAVLIQTPYDQNILIDGGDTNAQILQQLPKFMPFWDREIDMIMISHPHDDQTS